MKLVGEYQAPAMRLVPTASCRARGSVVVVVQVAVDWPEGVMVA